MPKCGNGREGERNAADLGIPDWMQAGVQGAPLHSCLCCMMAVHCILLQHAAPDVRQQAAWGRFAGIGAT